MVGAPCSLDGRQERRRIEGVVVGLQFAEVGRWVGQPGRWVLGTLWELDWREAVFGSGSFVGRFVGLEEWEALADQASVLVVCFEYARHSPWNIIIF